MVPAAAVRPPRGHGTSGRRRDTRRGPLGPCLSRRPARHSVRPRRFDRRLRRQSRATKRSRAPVSRHDRSTGTGRRAAIPLKARLLLRATGRRRGRRMDPPPLGWRAHCSAPRSPNRTGGYWCRGATMTSTNLSRLRLEGQKRVAVYHSSVLSPPDVSVVGPTDDSRLTTWRRPDGATCDSRGSA